MKTIAEVADWIVCAVQQFGDPSVPVCQLFFRWASSVVESGGTDELRALPLGDETLVLRLGFLVPPYVLKVRAGEPEVGDDRVLRYGLQPVSPGVWALSPSLNAPGELHAFVVLYDVPSPAPFETKLIVLGGGA